MTYKEEKQIFDTLKDIQDKTNENNYMLKQIIAFINGYIAKANSENDNDFQRNILANLISNMIMYK